MAPNPRLGRFKARLPDEAWPLLFGVRWLDVAFFICEPWFKKRKKAVSSHRTPKVRRSDVFHFRGGKETRKKAVSNHRTPHVGKKKESDVKPSHSKIIPHIFRTTRLIESRSRYFSIRSSHLDRRGDDHRVEFREGLPGFAVNFHS